MALVHQRGWDPAAFDESPWYRFLDPALSQLRDSPAFPPPEAFALLYAQAAEPLGLPPLTFIASPPKKPRRRVRREPVVLGELYEGQIMERGQVPTRRDDWHDFFNALAFVRFPRAKRALHARQYRLLAARLAPGTRKLPGARTREQDALSLFDEGGIALAVEPEALAQGPEAWSDWLASGAARAVPFGHALFEHLVAGLHTLGTLHVVPLAHRGLDPSALCAELDAALGEALADPAQFTEPSEARGVALKDLPVAL